MSGGVVCAFDLDNTLYDFIEWFGPAFRGMVAALARKTRIPKDALVSSASRVINTRGYIEYPFLVREMDVFQGLPTAQVTELEQLAGRVFRSVREKRLRPYPGAEEVLSTLAHGGATLAAVTNAPLYQSYKRLRDLGLLDHFHFLIAIENPIIPGGVLLKARARPWESRLSPVCITIERSEAKPSPFPYRRLMQAVNSENGVRYSIGDNIQRDLAPAAACGYRTVWAKYGRVIDERNYTTVLSISPADVKTHERSDGPFSPDYVLDGLAELLDIIRVPRQAPLI